MNNPPEMVWNAASALIDADLTYVAAEHPQGPEHVVHGYPHVVASTVFASMAQKRDFLAAKMYEVDPQFGLVGDVAPSMEMVPFERADEEKREAAYRYADAVISMFAERA